jgi:hypothetical protein
MTDEENYILEYLKISRNYFASEREITMRAAGRHHAEASPEWAKMLLKQMARRQILEMDPAGHYRIKPRDVKANGRRWISPHLASILKKSEKDFASSVTIEIADDMDTAVGQVYG